MRSGRGRGRGRSRRSVIQEERETYRDRARERREGLVTQDDGELGPSFDGNSSWRSEGLDRAHLVKGLDFDLLQRTRQQLREERSERTVPSRGDKSVLPGQVKPPSEPERERGEYRQKNASLPRFGNSLASKEVAQRVQMATMEREELAKTKRKAYDLLLSSKPHEGTLGTLHTMSMPAAVTNTTEHEILEEDVPPPGAVRVVDQPPAAQLQQLHEHHDFPASTSQRDQGIQQVTRPVIAPQMIHPTAGKSPSPAMHAPVEGSSDDEDIFEGVGRGELFQPTKEPPKVGILADYTTSDESEEEEVMEGPSLPKEGYEMYRSLDEEVMEGPSLPKESYEMYRSLDEEDEIRSSGEEEDEESLPPAPVPISEQAIRALQEERSLPYRTGSSANDPRWKVKRSREELLKELEGRVEGGEYDNMEEPEEDEEEEKKKKDAEVEEDEKAVKAKTKRQRKAKLNQEYQKIQSLLKRKEENQEGFQIRVRDTGDEKDF